MLTVFKQTLAQLFEKFVKDDLGRSQDIVINAGSSGATTASTISDLNRRLVKYDPDVVVLMLGTNDAGTNVAHETYQNNLRTILNKILAKGAVPVLCTPPPTSRSNYDIETYAQLVRDVANEAAYRDNVILVDQYARWASVNWGDVFTRDTLHPDEAGHLWFAHQLIREMALWGNDYDICKLEYVTMEEPEPIVIPGYTQLTNLSQLDENKGYMIVSQDAQGNLYALYPSEEGKTLGAGELFDNGTENAGARAASLTVSGDTVTAKWLKDSSTQNMEKLLFTIKKSGSGYIFTAFNGRHLNMADYMFTDGSVVLTVTNRGTAALNAFEIKNPDDGHNNVRVLDFNKYGDSSSFNQGSYATDFWCPRAVNIPIYLFASDTARVPTAKESIKTLIREDISKLTEADYTRASWGVLQAAKTAAETELNKFNEQTMTGDEANFVTARDNLQSAYDNLQRRPVIPTVPSGATIKENASMVPASGTTRNEPFASGTGGSSKFRIPAIITLRHQSDPSKNGRLLAAIDARWNHTGDACGLDTIVSYSDDNGGSWNYNFPNYFGDSIDARATYGTAFIDPVLVEGNDGTVYLMVDLWPGGVALNTAPMRPANATGYEVIDGVKRLVLYTSPVTGSQSGTNYSYYIGGFADGYAPVYEPLEGDDAFSGFYVDESYYLYHTDGNFAGKTPANDKIYCQRLGEDSWVQQNIFFYNASLHARNVSYLWIVKSTDGGATWTRSPNYATSTDRDSSESCLVQINATTVRHFYRDSWSNSKVVRYTDHTWNGSAWTTGPVVRVDSAPRWGACQLSAIKYSRQVGGKDLILYSAPASGSGRAQGVIHALLVESDGKLSLYNTYSVNGNNAYAYSSLTETKNGNIALLYESTSDAVIFEIIPIDRIIPELTATGYEGSYDGQPHSISVTAAAGITMTYSTVENGSYTAALPAFADAGSYTVYYKATKDGKTVSGSAHVTITRAVPALVISCNKGTQLSTGDLPLAITVSGAPGEDQGKFTLTTFGDALRNLTHNGTTWTATPQLPPVTRTYTFTAVFDPAQTQDGTVISNPNYERTTAEITVTVTRPSASVDVDFSFSSKVAVDPETPIAGTYTVPYDGVPHSISDALVCGEGVTVQYHVPITDIEGNEIGDTWVEQPPTYTQPGEYTVSCMGSKGSSARSSRWC